MKRRDFIKKAGIAAAGASLSPLTFARAQASTYRLGMVTSWPTSLDTLYGGAQRVARYIEELTDGDVEVEAFPAGAQVGGLEVYDAVASGAFELGHTASYYYIGRDPTHAFFTSVPFGLTSQQQNAWLQESGQEFWNELNARDNLIAFPAGNTGPQMGGWFNRELNSSADLRGLTMRFPGLGGQVMDRAGVNIQNLPGGEIYLALETGVIDAADWVGPYDDQVLGLNQVATYYYGPSWAEPGPTVGTYVNLDFFNDLPNDIQQVIATASARVDREMLAEYEAKNSRALRELVAGGTQLRRFPEDVLQEFRRYSDEVNDEFAAGNELFARVYEDWQAFRERIREWHAISEYPFSSFVLEGEGA